MLEEDRRWEDANTGLTKENQMMKKKQHGAQTVIGLQGFAIGKTQGVVVL